MIKQKRVFITGGTGTIGRALLERLYQDNEIVVFSRNEANQVMLAKQFPKAVFHVGDIRNLDALKTASRGCQVGLFCASLKHVGVVNNNVLEAQEIIIGGAMNSRRTAIENGFECACFVSTDKSRHPTTLYGAMKYVAGESFIWNADDSLSTRLSTVILGNIMNSAGSVIPLIWDAIANEREMNLHDERMSRFMMTTEGAADAIERATLLHGYNVIPPLSSFMVKELFDIYRERFGLNYKIHAPDGLIERPYELLITNDDAPRTGTISGDYVIHYRNHPEHPAGMIDNEYSSLDHLIEKSELNDFLFKREYYIPRK